MKLYATTTSERASKGQGGKYLDIDITREGGEFLGSIQIRITKDVHGDLYNATIDFAEHVYVNGKLWLDAEVRDRDYIKGEKKKGDGREGVCECGYPCIYGTDHCDRHQTP